MQLDPAQTRRLNIIVNELPSRDRNRIVHAEWWGTMLDGEPLDTVSYYKSDLQDFTKEKFQDVYRKVLQSTLDLREFFAENDFPLPQKPSSESQQ